MKTTIALLLVLILVFALSSVAFAQYNTTWHYVDENAEEGLQASPVMLDFFDAYFYVNNEAERTLRFMFK